MKLLICLAMLLSCAAAIQDLSGKMITFPEKSDDYYVKVTMAQRNLSAVTLCHRSFTDLKRSHSFFSLTTAEHKTCGFQTLYNSYTEKISVWVKQVRADYESVDYVPNKWHSICATWDSTTGLVQLWMDGRHFTKKYKAEFPLSGQLQIILGQEQSLHEKRFFFPSAMTFVGMLTDVHMWDRVLSPCEIQSYMAEQSFTPGNVVNWAALDFEKRGRLFIDDKQTCNLSTL